MSLVRGARHLGAVPIATGLLLPLLPKIPPGADDQDADLHQCITHMLRRA